MKFYKAVVMIVLVIAVSLSSPVIYTKDHSSNPVMKSSTVSGTTASDRNAILQKIDLQVKKIKNRINFNFNKDYYDEDIPVFRHFENGIEQELFTQYYLYYDEQGKLIYADIAHYRGALYSIYYHNDELLHVEAGSVNSDMADVEAVIKKDPDYAFIQKDNSLCLEHAYQ